MRLATLLRAFLAASTLALVFAACGGTVVFEEQGEATGGNGNGGNGSGASGDGGASISTASQTGSVVAPVADTVGPGPGGGVDDVVSVGPGPGQGPGQGPGPGPSGGGFDPSGTGGEGAGPGPGGVGGADVGPTGAVGVGSSGGCNQFLDETNQYCYLAETCEDYRLELECELNGGSPYTCWCYQDGQYVGQCDQADSGCAIGGCCESFWVLPG